VLTPESHVSRDIPTQGMLWADPSTLVVVTQESGGPTGLMLHIVHNADDYGSTITMGIPVPATARVGGAITAAGTLITEGAPGRAVTVDRTGPDGSTTPLPVLTAGQGGALSFSDAAPTAGTYTYTFSYAGDATHLQATRTRSVEFVGNGSAQPSLTLTASRAIAHHLQPVTISAHLGSGTATRTVAIYAVPYGLPRLLIANGRVDAHGDLAVTYRPDRNTTYSAVFAGDARFARRTVSKYVPTAAVVSVSATGYVRNSRGYWVYQGPASASFRATVASAFAEGNTVEVTLQAYSGGAWHTTKKWWTARQYDELVANQFAVTRRTGLLRLRVATRADLLAASGSTPWVYFRFI
jgi:hypothetical protein